MEQLLLKMDNVSEVKVIAASAYNFRIELVKKVGKDDIPSLVEISNCLADRFGRQALLTKTNIPKYFNSDTLPFIARFKGEIIGYIIGVPLEHFNQESWCKYDTNLNKNNTIYTYAFIIKEKYRKSGGYGKTLKMIYLNWAKKRGYKYVTGHVSHGTTKNFSGKIEIIKLFSNWYGTKKAFEYYRRTI